MTTTIAPFTDTGPGWERALYAFLAEKERRSGSRRTVDAYSRMLQQFFGALGKTWPTRTSSFVERLIREFRRKTKQMETFRSDETIGPTVHLWVTRENARTQGQDWVQTIIRHCFAHSYRIAPNPIPT